MDPVILQIGPFTLHWYGVFIVGGAVLAAWLSARLAARAGENPDHIWNLLAWTLVIGILGARLYHVLSSPANGLGWDYYRENPLDIVNFWEGGFRGLGIYGGIIGGVLAILLYCTINRLNPVQYLDFIAPNMFLAQAVGRMGNFVNQELYGPPTELPWAFHINPSNPCQVPQNLPVNIQACGLGNLTEETLLWYANNGFHPTFLYEALWNLLMFFTLHFLIWQFGYRMRMGDSVLLYFVGYPLGRFWVELFRPDAWVMGSMATAQWIALIMIGGSALLIILRHRHWNWRERQEDSLAKLSRYRGLPPDVALDSTEPAST
jgi:phosphatidylglycerol:prolipoprotein diacylglycerol transferase